MSSIPPTRPLVAQEADRQRFRRMAERHQRDQFALVR
jgi:hypothetical protein